MKKLFVILMMFCATSLYAQGIFETGRNFSEGLALVWKEDKCGVIDKTGKVVIPFIYESAGDFHEGLACVKKDDKWGFIDKTGKVVIPFIYKYAGDFHEGLAYVQKDYNSVGFIDKTGKVVIPFIYKYAGDFHEGLACVMKDDKWGFIDKTGKVVVPFIYEIYNSEDFHEGVVRLWKRVGGEMKWGFIDKTGKVVVPFIYKSAGDFHEGLACVKKDDKWGFIDKTGKVVIPFIYKYAGDFHEGLAYVQKDYNSVGFIDKTGKKVVVPGNSIISSENYEISPEGFIEGMALVAINGEGLGYINETGKIVINLNNIQSVSQEKNNENNKVYDVVETMPSFPGGQTALMNYLCDNVVYPPYAYEKEIQGRVIVSFVVEKDGSIKDVKVAKSVDPSLDNEAVRVISNMPRWIPGTKNGSPVPVRYNIPVSFHFQ